MTPLPYLAAVEVSGSDARDFLHGQLSADVKGLGAGHTVSACYCDPKGRALDHLLVRADDHGGYTLLLAAGRVRGFVDRLKLFVLRSDVTLTPRDDVAVLAVEGATSADAPVRFDAPCGLQYALLPAADAEADAVAVARRRFAELEAGMLWLDGAASGRYLPQMLGLDTLGSVNFRKGCYPGQEVVARARYLGQVKRLPALAVVEGEIRLEAGDPVALLTSEGGEGHPAEAVSAAAYAGRTAIFLTLRERESLTPETVLAGERRCPVHRWATM